MNVLSLFDGMSCGMIALGRAGIKVENYYASEIDKYAIQVSQDNYPDIVRMGDVTNWRNWGIDWSSIDLLIGGSPCQGFSSSGKKGGTKAVLGGVEIIVSDRDMYLEMKKQGAEFLSCSYLFWEFVLLSDHIKNENPNIKFLLENVKMSRVNLDIISNTLEVQPVLINSALVSAQNRNRYYWANWVFHQPADKNVLINDILQQDTDKKYLVSDRQISRLIFNTNENGGVKGCFSNPIIKAFKSECLMARDYKGIPGKQNFTMCIENGNLRRLTPLEYERLQTVPDNYTSCVSNTQRYKMLGNGWTVDVIAHILSFIPCKSK